MRRIASLRDYVLVSQGEPLVEAYRRTGGGRFELFAARAGQTSRRRPRPPPGDGRTRKRDSATLSVDLGRTN
jgi:hypothetical protein